VSARQTIYGGDLGRPSWVRGVAGHAIRRSAFWVALIDLALLAVFAAMNPVLLSIQGVRTIALDSVEVLLLAIGSTLLLGAGKFDISIGANLGLSSVVATSVMQHVGGVTTIAQYGVSHQVGTYHHLALVIPIGVAACLVSGLLMGTANGLLVVRLRVNSLIATLGMLSVAEGITFVLSGGVNLAAPTELQSSFGLLSIAGIPAPVMVAAAAVVLLWFVVAKTSFGMRTLAMGSEPEAAVRAGIDVGRHQLALFVIAGGLAGVAGLVDISRFAFTNAAAHLTDPLAAIAAAVIGGTALSGGIISSFGTVFGVLLTTILEVGLVLMGVSSYYQLVVIGVVLIVVVSIYEMRRRRAEAGA
jgi:ribose transport system permease protein